MSGPLELLAFAGVMALGQFSPGPDMILLTRTALRNGANYGVRMAIGIACGLVFHSTIAFAGLALVLQRDPLVAGILRWMAAGYLLWMAWRILSEQFVIWYSGSISEREPVPSRHSPFVRGLLCNLLNPKAAIFLAAVSAPFLMGGHPAWWPVALGGIVVIQGAVLWSLWACLLQWQPLAGLYRKLERGIDLLFAAVLIVLAVGLVTGRH